MFLIFLMQALFALTFPIGKETLCYVPPCLITGLRFIIAGLLLIPYVAITHRGEWRGYAVRMLKNPRIWLATTLSYVYLSYVPEFFALQHLTAIKTNLLWSSAPFVSAVLEYVITGVRFTRTQWLGILIGTIGSLPIIFSCEGSSSLFETLTCVGWPEAALMVAVLATSYAWFLLKDLMADGYPLLWINGCTMFLGGALSIMTSLAFEPLPVTSSAWLWALVGAFALVLVSNIVGYTIYGTLLHRYSITFLSFSGFLCPVFGAFFCYLFLGEQLPMVYAISFAVICVGLYLFYKEELAHGITSLTEPTLLEGSENVL